MRQSLQRHRISRRVVCSLALACLPLAAPTRRPFRPSGKPIRLVVTYPAGGSSDLMARIMGQKLSEYWKTAGRHREQARRRRLHRHGIHGAPAGRRLHLRVGNLGPAAVNPLITKVPYSMDKDFVPVALTATGAEHPGRAGQLAVQDAGRHAGRRQGQARRAELRHQRPGSMAHLGGEMIMRQAGIKMAGVPTRAAARP
jgi:tripartite-type tricarboxylate transporter receptor subunit TctC